MYIIHVWLYLINIYVHKLYIQESEINVAAATEIISSSLLIFAKPNTERDWKEKFTWTHAGFEAVADRYFRSAQRGRTLERFR